MESIKPKEVKLRLRSKSFKPEMTDYLRENLSEEAKQGLILSNEQVEKRYKQLLKKGLDGKS